MEEKSREIAEAAHEYAYTRWRNWIPILIIVAVALVVYALTQRAGDYVMGGAMDRSELDVARLTERAKTAARLSIILQLLGTVVIAWLAYRIVGRWRFGDPAVTMAPPQAVGTSAAEPTSKFRDRVLYLGQLALFAVLSFYGFRLLFQSSPRFQPLIVSGALTLLVLPMLLSGRRRPGSRTRSDSPGPTIGLIAANAYALAIAAGLPRPFGGTSADTAETFGLIAPTALLFMCWAVGDAIYSRRQFRRLQRLVNEEPDGTD